MPKTTIQHPKGAHRVRVGGFTRSRVTTAAPHPMRTRRTVTSSLRSSNPRIRASAKAAAIALGVHPAPTPKRGWRRPERQRVGWSWLPNRDSLEG